jgi:drug/metabolite transporter (DMT)-like permease
MRRRGFIILLASLPTWAIGFVLSRNFWKENQVWGGDLAVPPFLSGVAWAAIASTVLALCFLLFDFVSWYRKRNDRTNQTD